MPDSPSWIRAGARGAVLNVYVQPGASRSGVAGRYGTALKLRVAAPPVDGAANEAVLELLSTMLQIPKSSLQIIRGVTARKKQVSVRGLGVAAVLAHLAPLVDSPGSGD